MCGYAVDWLRSCYIRTWKFVTDAPSECTGQFYFSPPGTPFFPHLHNFGSSVWDTDDPVLPSTLGERDTIARIYKKGIHYAGDALPGVTGPLADIQNGESAFAPFPTRHMVNAAAPTDVQDFDSR